MFRNCIFYTYFIFILYLVILDLAVTLNFKSLTSRYNQFILCPQLHLSYSDGEIPEAVYKTKC